MSEQERRPGRTRLVYDKVRRTIVMVKNEEQGANQERDEARAMRTVESIIGEVITEADEEVVLQKLKERDELCLKCGWLKHLSYIINIHVRLFDEKLQECCICSRVFLCLFEVNRIWL